MFIAPFEMRLPAQKSARQPDILVIRRENLDRLSRERLDGPADPVSYTHLDVYKRQGTLTCLPDTPSTGRVVRAGQHEGTPVTKPVVLIAEELSPATLDALGPDFEIRSCDGADLSLIHI